MTTETETNTHSETVSENAHSPEELSEVIQEDDYSSESITRSEPNGVLKEVDLEKPNPTSPTPETPTQKLPEVVPLPKKQLIIVFTGMFLAVLLAALDQTIVATAVPAIVSDLGNLNDISWIFVAYLLTSTAFMPLYGKMGDIFGRTRVFIFAIVSFMIGSLLCGVATTMTFLIIARAIQGIGGGGLIALVMIIISDIVPLSERGKYQGLIGATFAVASVIGPLVGGLFVDHLTWRWLFYINLPIGVVCICVISYGLKLTPFKLKLLKTIDYSGTLLIVGAVVCVVLAASWGGDRYAWDSAAVISLFVVGGVLFALFTVNELKIAREPIMQFKLFKIRNVSISTFLAVCLGYPMFGCIAYLPVYFQVVDGKSATEAGLQMLPAMFGIIVGSIGSGIIVSKIGRYNFFPMIGFPLATIGIGLTSTFGTEQNLGKEVGFLLITGLGLGLCIQTILIAAQSSVEHRYIAVLTATVNFFRTIGGVFGVTIFGAIFNHEMSSHFGAGGGLDINAIQNLPPAEKAIVLGYFVDAFSKMFVYAVPVTGAGFLVAVWMKHIAMRGPPKVAPGGAKQAQPETHQMVEL